ncbi:MAG: haloacid dehalogenase [Patescibacteria group bacterium]|nr:MAG: haloacid dehalogenase [Patescibacteria group bacterium]
MLKAVIFDLNGTILDDEEIYAKSFKNVLLSLGVKVGDNFTHTTGIGVKENWANFKAKYHFNTDKSLDELSSLTQEEYLKEFPKVKLRAGFLEFVRNLRLSGIKTAIATSNDYRMVEKFFEKFGLEEYFDVVTSCEEVSLNKPSPQIFLITASKLGVEPHECLVFEDSQAGAISAKLAGMMLVKMVEEKSDKKYQTNSTEVKNGISDFNNLVNHVKI